MKRKVIDKLIKWKNKKVSKPILLTGAKGVGKTYLAYDFAKAFFEQIYYINFEREPKSVPLFCDFDIKGLEDYLIERFQIPKDNLRENRILILDEIYFCPNVITQANALQKSGVFPNIVMITSNPIPSMKQMNLEHLPVYPMEFDEFLLATANEWYIELIRNHFESNKKIPEIVHNELLTLHQLYLQIGGMPGSINEYLSFLSAINIPEQHNFLISSYHDYILKELEEGDALKMNQVFNSLVFQLNKANKKFQYKLIRKGTTYTMYKDAIQDLIDRNYVIKCCKLSDEFLLDFQKQFSSSEWMITNSNFKLYYPDIGLLYTKMVEEGDLSLTKKWNKSILENYVAQSLQTTGYTFGFWESNSMAKIDFIIQKENKLLPIEIYSNENTRSKSISVFKQKVDFPYSIKISTKNFDYSNQIKYVPNYAVFCL